MTKKRDEAEYARQAFRSIKDQFGRLSIFGRPLSIAIYNYVAAAEFDALLSSATNPGSGLHSSHRRMVEASARVIPKIYRDCGDIVVNDEELREDTYFDEAQEAYDSGHKLEAISYAYELVDRGQFRLNVAKVQPRISFAYSATEADQSDTRLRASEVLAIASPKGSSPINHADELINELRPLVRAVKRIRCDYEYSDRLIEIARDFGREKLSRTNRLQLPEAFNVLSFTIRDLRAFWGAMMALTEVHIVAHWIGDDGLLNDLPLNTIVLCKEAKDFVDILSRISELTADTVHELLALLTYDPAIADDVPILQPFLSLSDGRLCLPSSFVNGNNFERNFRKLLHRHRQLRKFAADFEAQLEPEALRSLGGRFDAPRYRVRMQVQIPEVTDVDLLVFDVESGFALLIQHKWLIGPDSLNESISNDEKLARGVAQAMRSLEYLRDNSEFLRPTFELTRDQKIKEIEGVVVCRGLDGTGFLKASPNIPLVTESDFIELLGQAEDLPILWKLLVARPDHDRAEAQATDIKSELSLGGYQFILPGLAIQMALK